MILNNMRSTTIRKDGMTTLGDPRREKKRRARKGAPPPAPELPPRRPRRQDETTASLAAPPRPYTGRSLVLSAAAQAAIARAERAFLQLAVPRPYARKAQIETYERRRQQFIDTMRRAGMTPGQIRARLGVVTRRRNQLRLCAVSAEGGGRPSRRRPPPPVARATSSRCRDEAP